jgi:hypothetical protein
MKASATWEKSEERVVGENGFLLTLADFFAEEEFDIDLIRRQRVSYRSCKTRSRLG